MHALKSFTLVFCLSVGLCGCPEADGPADESDAASRDAAAVGPNGDRERAKDDEDSGTPGRAMQKPAATIDAGSSHPPASKPQDDDADRDAGVEPAAAGRSAPSSPDAGAPNAPPAAPQVGEIETVVVDVVYIIGVGGSPLPDIRPVILFKDGSACRDMNFVVEGLDVAAHRAKYPNDWTEWKIIDNKLALRRGEKWFYLDFQIRFAPNDASLALENTYSRITGGGDTAAGGTTLIYAESNFRLTADHHFALGNFSAVTSSSTVFANTAPDQRGTYRIDGYRITLRWDDGKVTETSFVYSSSDPSAFYLSGRSFVVVK